MSADNGVYILKTGRQYRVAHLQAIDNLYWNKEKGCMENTMQSNRIIEMFGDCKCTIDVDKALYIANKIMQDLSICEYGIVILDAHKSWKQILEESNNESTKEDNTL